MLGVVPLLILGKREEGDTGVFEKDSDNFRLKKVYRQTTHSSPLATAKCTCKLQKTNIKIYKMLVRNSVKRQES